MAPIAKGKVTTTGLARSRNTTPLSATSTEPGSVARKTTPLVMSYREISELCRNSTTPSPAILRRLVDGLRQRSDAARIQASHHDTSFRDASKRKARELEKQHELEVARTREEEEVRSRAKPRFPSPKKEEESEEERPLAVGARGLARQDGAPPEVHPPPDDDIVMKDAGDSDPIAVRRPSPSQAPDFAESSMPEQRQPKPAPSRPQYQTFGPDPSTFEDPTIYHIRDPDATSTEEDKKEILGVARYPDSDLYEYTCGTAPDKNLENAKPAQQTSAHVFALYVEPYFRKFTEEDVQWLKERGDRVTPFTIPARGTRGYKEVWADEDNEGWDDRVKSTPTQTPTNQAHGSIDEMNEDVTETSDVSVGPMLARLLQCMRPERRADTQATNNVNANTNGDTTMTNGTDGDVSMTDGGQPAAEQQSAHRPPPRRDTLPPATALPESAISSRVQATKPSWAEMDERVKQELRYIGFLSEEAEPNYDGHYDDDIAARLRYLQDELQRTSEMNGARKARMMELVEDAQAVEEYTDIVIDQETQLNQAYMKRHRNTSKGKGKLKRAGAAAGYENTANGQPGVAFGIGRPAIGENIRQIMQRRNDWQSLMGPMNDYGRVRVPEESVFGDAAMREYLIRERENWAEVQDS